MYLLSDLADGLFPNKRAIDGEGDLEEERRLFYVASTRAERRLHLVFPMLSSQNGTQIRLMQSRFLKELPQTQTMNYTMSMPKTLLAANRGMEANGVNMVVGQGRSGK